MVLVNISLYLRLEELGKNLVSIGESEFLYKYLKAPDDFIRINSDNLMPLSNTGCMSGYKCYENSDLMIQFDAYLETGSNIVYAYLYARWDSDAIPTVKSFDIMGIRWDNNNFIIDKYNGYQRSDAGLVHYAIDGTNTKQASNGIGTAMNIVDDTSYYLEFELSLVGHLTNSSGNVFYASYQHAQKDLILNEARSFTFGSGGLGNVFVYSVSSIKNSYSNYPGLVE